MQLAPTTPREGEHGDAAAEMAAAEEERIDVEVRWYKLKREIVRIVGLTHGFIRHPISKQLKKNTRLIK